MEHCNLREQYRLVLRGSEAVSVPSEKQQADRYAHETEDTVASDPPPCCGLEDILPERVMSELPADGRTTNYGGLSR